MTELLLRYRQSKLQGPYLMIFKSQRKQIPFLACLFLMLVLCFGDTLAYFCLVSAFVCLKWMEKG